MAAGQRVEVGRIQKAHGLAGEVVVSGVRLSLEEFEALGVVEVRDERGTRRKLTIQAVRPRVPHVLVRFQGVDDRDQADALRGQILEIEASQLPETSEGEVYLFQLLGLSVRTEDGAELGRVSDVIPTGARPVLVVHGPPVAEGDPGQPRERLIPMSPDVLVRVDTAGGFVTVRLLPGMEDL